MGDIKSLPGVAGAILASVAAILMPKLGLKSLFICEIRGISGFGLPNSDLAETAPEGTPTALVPRLKLL